MMLLRLMKKIIYDLIKFKKLIKSYFINPTNEFFYKKSRIFFEDMNKLRQYLNLVEKK